MINIAIVEDNKPDSTRLSEYINKFLIEKKEETLISVFQSGLDFLCNYQKKYDIVFMDIEMPDITGLETSKRLRKLDGNVILVFVTNMAQFAVDGYQVDALDFVVKPINYYSFALRMQRVLEHLYQRRNEFKITIKNENGIRVVLASNILFVEVMRHDLIYHTEKEKIICRGALKDIEEDLEKIGFFKCNRCYLVNLKYVTSINGGEVFVNNHALQISRARRKEFVSAIAEYYGRGGGR